MVGQAVTLSLEIAHMPVNLYSEYINNGELSSTFFTLSTSTPTSDGSGKINFTWTLADGNPGYWGIFFKIDGKITIPFLFKTQWDAGIQVSILTEPGASGDLPVGEYLDGTGGTTAPIIQVKDSSNANLQNYMVSTTLIPVTAAGVKDTSATRKEGMLDPYTTTFEDVEVHSDAGTL